MTRVWGSLLLLMATACGSGEGIPQDTGPHAYLMLTPTDEQKGWVAIEGIRAQLPEEERRLIRTAGLVSNKAPQMYVDFDGDCSAGFVTSATRIATQAGTPGASCTATLPGAL